MSYKCIFSDLDYTLLSSQGNLSEETVKAIEAVTAGGIKFVPATGRAFYSLPKDLFEVKGIDYVITSNGAVVRDMRTKEVAIGTYLPVDFIEKFFEEVTIKPGSTVEVYVDGRAFSLPDYKEDSSKYGNSRVEYVRSTRVAVDDMKEFALANKDRIDCIAIVSVHELQEEYIELVKTNYPEVYVTNSDNCYTEISNIECGKHNALKKVCKLYGCDTSEVVAFGDNDNDVEMLNTAALGVAVANGTPKCLEAADRITLSNDENGVAAVLKELFPQFFS